MNKIDLFESAEKDVGRKTSNRLTNMKIRKAKHKRKSFIDEEREWLNFSMQKRILETTNLWKLYIALGGSLDPEPDPQSPFYFKEA